MNKFIHRNQTLLKTFLKHVEIVRSPVDSFYFWLMLQIRMFNGFLKTMFDGFLKTMFDGILKTMFDGMRTENALTFKVVQLGFGHFSILLLLYIMY